MKKFDLPLILDVLFYSLAVGAVSFCILRYFRLPLPLSFFVSLLFLLSAAILVYIFTARRHRKMRLSKKQESEKRALMLHLALERPERVRALLLSALLADGKEAHLEKELRVDDTSAVFAFTMQPLSADAVAKLLQEYGREQFLLFCNSLSPESESLLFQFSIKTYRADEVYSLISRTDCMPKELICGNLPQKTAKTRLLAAIKKSNARPIFVSGLLLLLMSLFTVFPLYYLISGCLLVLSAVAVRLFGYSPA